MRELDVKLRQNPKCHDIEGFALRFQHPFLLPGSPKNSLLLCTGPGILTILCSEVQLPVLLLFSGQARVHLFSASFDFWWADLPLCSQLCEDRRLWLPLSSLLSYHGFVCFLHPTHLLNSLPWRPLSVVPLSWTATIFILWLSFGRVLGARGDKYMHFKPEAPAIVVLRGAVIYFDVTLELFFLSPLYWVFYF